MVVIVEINTVLVFTGSENRKAVIQRKIEGFWNIELDSSHIYDREYNCCVLVDDESFWCNVLIDVKSNGIIKLPCSQDTKEKTGNWKIISTNPDSIVFNVPQNPFHGSYAVKFYMGITLLGKLGYKMTLQNDSTLLTCSKGGAVFDRDVKNW
jgi:hypothetical protein